MTPRLAAAALATVLLAASAGSCEELPDGVPTNLPTIPTDLPDLPDLPTDLPDIPTDLPDLPTSLPDIPTALPDLGGDEAEPEETEVAPAPESVEPSVPVSEEPVAEEVDEADPVPWWVWLLLAVAVLGLVVGLILLRRSRRREAAWRTLWGELSTEARWIDERVVPSVQDRGISASTAAMRWSEGRRRLEALDRRVYDEVFRAQTANQGLRLDELSAALVGLRDAVDAEVEVRQNGATDDDPQLAAAAEDVAASRDELRRVLAGERR